MPTADILVLLLLVAGAAASARWKKLTPAAALTGVGIGWAIYAGTGWLGLLLLAVFFITGTAATSWKKKAKLLIRGSAAHEPTRTPGQVIANAGVAALMGGCAFFRPSQAPLFLLMLAASLASATADTLSSELGMVYGRRCYNILTWKKDERGLDGVISIEGLFIGAAGSALIAAIYGLWTGIRTTPPHHPGLPAHSLATHFPSLPAHSLPPQIIIITLAGIAGNLADSLLGALLERRGYISNNTVNFLNTLIAAIFAGACAGFHS